MHANAKASRGMSTCYLMFLLALCDASNDTAFACQPAHVLLLRRHPSCSTLVKVRDRINYSCVCVCLFVWVCLSACAQTKESTSRIIPGRIDRSTHKPPPAQYVPPPTHTHTHGAGISSGSRMFSVIERTSAIDSEADGDEPTSCDGTLALHSVSFCYPARPDVMVLRSLTLDIPAGGLMGVGREGWAWDGHGLLGACG